MGGADSEIKNEIRETQVLVVKPEHFRAFRVFTSITVYSIMSLVLFTVWLLNTVLPFFVSCYEEMNLTLPFPAKILYTMMKCFQLFSQFGFSQLLFYFFVVAVLLFVSVKLIQYIVKKSREGFSDGINI